MSLQAVAQEKPRVWTPKPAFLRLSGLEHAIIDKSLVTFANIGERCNIAGSIQFKKLILAGKFMDAMAVARKQVCVYVAFVLPGEIRLCRLQVEDGAMILDVNMDEGLLDGKAAMTKFLRIAATEPDVAKVPFMIDSSKFEIIEAGLKNVQVSLSHI